jgi:hypothetical protein
MMCRRCGLALLALALAAGISQAQFPGPFGYGMRIGRFRGPMGMSITFGGLYPPPAWPSASVMYPYPAGMVVLSRPAPVIDPLMLPLPTTRPVQPGGGPPGNFIPPPVNRPAVPEENPPPPAKPPEKKAEPEKKPRPRREAPRRPLPEEDPQGENARLLEAGKAAFAAAEYGRAADCFGRAVAIAPREPLAHFLFSQTLFTQGKYPAAVDALVAGLAVAPDWPTKPFRPLDLYGANVADYSEHLRRLADALREHPDDPDLLFLDACQLWFDGRRDEARLLFERARRRGANPLAIDSFLRALPEAPVV